MNGENLKMKNEVGIKNTINIKTWNVDWFRNKKRSGQEWEYNENDCDLNAYINIVKDIKDFLDSRQNAIVLLQEVPYKIKDGAMWLECDYHKKLHNDFPTNEFEIVEKISRNYITRCTIAIFKKRIFSRDLNFKPCNNRIIGLNLGDDITVLGVHMPTNFKEDDQNDHMWRELIEYTTDKKAKKEKIIIAGDFNGYIGCKNKLTEKRFIELARVAKDIVSDDTPTYIGQTPIDHIFINFNSDLDYKVVIEKDWGNSDHKYLQAELKY